MGKEYKKEWSLEEVPYLVDIFAKSSHPEPFKALLLRKDKISNLKFSNLKRPNFWPEISQDLSL